MSGEPQDAVGRLKGELRATRERQARLRYQVRHQQRALTRLREEASAALNALSEGRTADAEERLGEALARSTDPDEEHTPPGAKRKALQRAMRAKRSGLGDM